MRKMFFLMLAFFVWNAASVNAQVRIGDISDPTPGAVLDLTGGSDEMALLLPVVQLATGTHLLEGNTPTAGMIVYSSGGALTNGIYYWENNKWNAVNNGGNGGNGGNGLADCPYVVPDGVFTQKTEYVYVDKVGNSSEIQPYFNQGGTMCLAQYDIVGAYTWDIASTVCETIYGSDWRLPTIAELYNITPSEAALLQTSSYWSSTEFSSTLILCWNYSTNKANSTLKVSNSHHIRCVKTL
jgi:hypothetical protein